MLVYFGYGFANVKPYSQISSLGKTQRIRSVFFFSANIIRINVMLKKKKHLSPKLETLIFKLLLTHLLFKSYFLNKRIKKKEKKIA